MIDDLVVAKSAHFYEVSSRITDKAVTGLFRSLRAQAQRPTNNLFEHVREDLNGSKWSAICFAYERNPGFLDPPPNIRERVYGFLMVVEHQTKVAIIKTGLELPADFKATHLERIDPERVEAALAHGNTVFEKMRLRNMSPSRHVLRSKTLESEDLRNVVGPAGSNRFAPQGFSLRRDDTHFATTPNTGRIAQRSDPTRHEDLVNWCATIIEELSDQNAQVDPFLRTFARSVSLETYGARLRATSFSVNTALLAEEFLDPEPPLRMLRRDGDDLVALSHDEMVGVIGALNVPLSVRKVRKEQRLEPMDGARRTLGRIRINKSRISLLALAVGGAEELIVESTDAVIGEDPNAQPLRSHINRESRFILLFDDLALSYIDGRLYRDDQFAAGGEELLRFLLTEPSLAAATSEKGALAVGQRAFDPDCVFGVVTNQIAPNDNVFVCDDLMRC